MRRQGGSGCYVAEIVACAIKRAVMVFKTKQSFREWNLAVWKAERIHQLLCRRSDWIRLRRFIPANDKKHSEKEAALEKSDKSI